MELLTITSQEGRLSEREERIPDLFPETSKERPHKFSDKDCVFVTARVHPGETQGSHMLNGLLAFLMKEYDILDENRIEEMRWHSRRGAGLCSKSSPC